LRFHIHHSRKQQLSQLKLSNDNEGVSIFMEDYISGSIGIIYVY